MGGAIKHGARAILEYILGAAKGNTAVKQHIKRLLFTAVEYC